MHIRELLYAVVLVGVATPAFAQDPPPVSVTLTGRMHFQWNSTSVDDEELGEPIASHTFETRRVRPALNIRVGDWIRGLIEPDLALARLQLRQVWAAFEFDSAFVVRAGQFKKPFSLIFLTSSTVHPMIERGVRIRGLSDLLEASGLVSSVRGVPLIGEQHTLLEAQAYLAYELGASVEGRYRGLSWAAGVFNGTGPDLRDENDSKSFAARAAYTVDVGTPLTFGAAWSRRELPWPTATSDTTRTGDAFEADLELGGLRRGVWVLLEGSTGTNLATDERFVGAQGVVSYFLETGGSRLEGIEPMARVSWGDPDRTVDDDAGILLTPGLNLYFFGRNRFMLNWDVYLPQADAIERQHAGRAQVNLYW